MQRSWFQILLMAGAAALACSVQAGSIVGSSADAGVAGSRGSSDSVKTSSNSSAQDDKTAAIQNGAYRVAAVLPAAGAQDDAVVLTLQPRDAAQATVFQLEVPRQAFAGAQPQTGEIVQAQRRAYGVQLARGMPQEPFFMVLNDAVAPEVASRPLTP